MSLIKHKALVIASADDELAATHARSISKTVPGPSPELTYDELSREPLALSRLMARNPTSVIIKGSPWTRYSAQFMAALATPEKLPCDLPEKYFSMKPAPYFIFLVHSDVPLRATHPNITVENLL